MSNVTIRRLLAFGFGGVIGLLLGFVWHELVHIMIYDVRGCAYSVELVDRAVWVSSHDCYWLTEAQRSADASGYHSLLTYALLMGIASVLIVE